LSSEDVGSEEKWNRRVSDNAHVTSSSSLFEKPFHLANASSSILLQSNQNQQTHLSQSDSMIVTKLLENLKFSSPPAPSGLPDGVGYETGLFSGFSSSNKSPSTSGRVTPFSYHSNVSSTSVLSHTHLDDLLSQKDAASLVSQEALLLSGVLADTGLSISTNPSTTSTSSPVSDSDFLLHQHHQLQQQHPQPLQLIPAPLSQSPLYPQQQQQPHQQLHSQFQHIPQPLTQQPPVHFQSLLGLDIIPSSSSTSSSSLGANSLPLPRESFLFPSNSMPAFEPSSNSFFPIQSSSTSSSSSLLSPNAQSFTPSYNQSRSAFQQNSF